MELERLVARLVADAHLHQPMEIFEPLPGNGSASMHSLIGKCEEMSGPPSERHSFYLWLGLLRAREGLAFYGSALSSPSAANDIDLLCFSPLAVPAYHMKPQFVHIHGTNFDSRGIPENDALLVAGQLLFLAEPPAELLSAVEAARIRILANPFFINGIGDLVTHGAFKALNGEPLRGNPQSLVCPRFTVRTQWLDDSSMMTRTYSPREQNNQVRQQMQGLKDDEVYALALAGMRRIRVKEEKREELAERFVKELRAKKIHGSFG